MNCTACGQPYIRCNCESQQPFCDNCADDTRCTDTLDAQCVIYHKDTDEPSKLENLGMPNDSTVEEILEAIDDLIGNSGNISLVANDSGSINFTTSGPANHIITGVVKISEEAGNILVLDSSGLYVPEAEETDLTANDSSSINFTTSGTGNHTLTGVVKLSANAGNLITSEADGLHVATLAQTVLTANDSTSIDFTTSGTNDHTLTGVVKISATPGNLISIAGDGLLVTSVAQTSLTANDSTSIDFTTSGTANHTLTGAVKISVEANNILEIKSDGLFVEELEIVATDSDTIDFTVSGGDITADVIIDPISTNTLTSSVSGLLAVRQPATNGLTEAGTTPYGIKLGGEIIETTSLYNTANTFSGLVSVSATRPFNSTEYWVHDASLTLTTDAGGHGGTTGFEYANGGQLVIWPSTNIALRSSIAFYAGTYGTVIKAGAGDVSNGVISGGHFLGYAAGTGDVSDMAAVRVGAAGTPPGSFGSAFSGTITNYYGVLVEDVGSSTYAANITNKYGIYIKGASGILNVAETAFTTPSDVRIKENIKSISYGLSEIEKLVPVEYTIINDERKAKKIGFIAQDVEKIIPEAVKQSGLYDYDDFRLLDKEVIFTVMINAIKELSQKVKILETKVNN